ncbi:hypothetical protein CAUPRSCDRAFT_12142 [Caulochytrium protostelioides]|uniref:Uncharacterized protein n=1 Tax=Caulochytrium protostelioides TaxID=1555241 RepID=A0A4P9WTZ5_9FUNG|nr:hypothetical protein CAUPRSCDRAFT_12142 [Caulochytrium protostelioides]
MGRQNPADPIVDQVAQISAQTSVKSMSVSLNTSQAQLPLAQPEQSQEQPQQQEQLLQQQVQPAEKQPLTWDHDGLPGDRTASSESLWSYTAPAAAAPVLPLTREQFLTGDEHGRGLAAALLGLGPRAARSAKAARKAARKAAAREAAATARETDAAAGGAADAADAVDVADAAVDAVGQQTGHRPGTPADRRA